MKGGLVTQVFVVLREGSRQAIIQGMNTMSQTNQCLKDPADLLRIQTELKKATMKAASHAELYSRLAEVCMTFPPLDCIWIWSRKTNTDNLYLEVSLGADQQVISTLSQVDYSDSVSSYLMVGHEVVGQWEDVWGEKVRVFKDGGFCQVGAMPLDMTDGSQLVLGFASRQSQSLENCLLNALRLVVLELGQRYQGLNQESRLLAARENFSQIISALDGYLFVVDQRGQMLHSNLSEHELGADLPNIDTIIPDAQRLIKQQREGVSSVVKIDKNPANQCRLKVRNNQLLPVEVKVRAIQWNNDQAYLIACRDITEQLIIEKERNRLETAIEQTADGILITDSSGAIQYTNPAFSSMTGYSSSEVLGANPSILKSNRHDSDFYDQMWSTIRRGVTWQGRVANRTKSGDEYWQVATISPVLDPSGIITHFVGVQRDITSELKLEERLRQSQKLEAIGTLAGGIAHDFNNILYALLGNSQLALDDIPPEHPAYLPMTEIVKAGERGSALVAKMLAFGQRSEKQRMIKPLQPIIREVMELVRASLPTTICIELNLAENCPEAMLDDTQIHQAVLNLCTNSAYAMREAGGVLSLELMPMTVRENTPEVINGVLPGEYLKLTVRDNGVGMAEAVLSRIFEPYFTTKQSDEGTGLGLASVHGIVSNHDGKILVESTPGKGTVFNLFFPAAIGKGAEDTDEFNIEKAVRGSSRVMIVDDERMIIDVVNRGLTKLGFEVSGFTDVVEALEVFRKDPFAFDVVITDQTMPEISGFELATQVSSLRPDLPIILSTGYSETVCDQNLKQAGVSHFMPKPLRIKDLAALLCQLTQPQDSKEGV